jgi:hypothetical protein
MTEECYRGFSAVARSEKVQAHPARLWILALILKDIK